MKHYDFIILGAGIFGVTTAIELCKRKYSVALLNPGHIPHPLAESTDISKIIRMEYGTDVEYMEMVEECLPKWREWNDLFRIKLYHETGFLLLSRQSLDENKNSFESASYHNLIKKNYRPERLTKNKLSGHFPFINAKKYADAFYHSIGGYAESGKAIEALTHYAKQSGCDIHEEQTAERLLISGNTINGVKTKEERSFSAGHVIVCAGNLTPFLVPDLKPFMKITGHPVFHIKPTKPELFSYPSMTVFAADISNTGWYGFPLHPIEGVVKIANHGTGLIINDPEKDERKVYDSDISDLKKFLNESIPSLVNDPIVYTRRCCYTDTLDGHFWIDNHPEIKNLTIGSGGSGHGFKMGPLLGDMIATVAEGGNHKWSTRYRWRYLDQSSKIKEEARFVSRSLSSL
jgi:glycine/D-amino acid oxidase-like deaminating enzyme